MFLTVKQKVLVTLVEHGTFQNSGVVESVGVTEQWCIEMVNALYADGLVESEFIAQRRLNKLALRGVEVARRLREVSEDLKNHGLV